MTAPERLPPYSLRHPTWAVPALSLWALAALASRVHALMDPLTARISFQVSPLEDLVEVARVSVAVRAWGLSYIATALACCGAMAIGVRMTLRLSAAADRDARRHRIAGRTLVALVLVAMLVGGLVDRYVQVPPPYWDWLQRDGADAVLSRPIHDVLYALSALIAGGMGSLFAASTVLIARVEEAMASADPRAALQRFRDQLLVLVSAGALGTSLAVLHFATSHRLPAAALVAPTEELRQAQAAALDRIAAFEALYWGGSYTVGLALLYLVPTAVIVGAMAKLEADEKDPTPEPATIRSWSEVLGPALRAAAVLAPLATGTVAPLLSGLFPS